MHRDKIEVVLPPLRTPAAYASLILLFYMSENVLPRTREISLFFEGKEVVSFRGKKERNLAGPFPFVDFGSFSFQAR